MSRTHLPKHVTMLRQRAFSISSLLVAVTLSACHQQPSPPDQATHGLATTPSSPSAPLTAPLTHHALSDHGRLVLNAVPGNPAAAYFTLINHRATPMTLIDVTIAGAGKTMMHETKGGAMHMLASVIIPVGGAIQFMPGARHVMVFDLAPSLHAGGTTRITFHFADGSTTIAALKIEAAGDAAQWKR